EHAPSAHHGERSVHGSGAWGPGPAAGFGLLDAELFGADGDMADEFPLAQVRRPVDGDAGNVSEARRRQAVDAVGDGDQGVGVEFREWDCVRERFLLRVDVLYWGVF